MDLITTQLGRFNATGKGFITRGLPGAHNATVTVTGAGEVSATVVIRGGNSPGGLVQVATLSPSGSGSATSAASWSEDYRYWEAEVISLSGASVLVDVASDPAASGDVAGGGSTTVVNNLTSTSTTSALSANQGRLLNEELATKKAADPAPAGFTSRSLASSDNGAVLVCASAQTATVPSGLPAAFGCSFKGTISFTAGSGVTVTDVRTTGTTNPWCALVQTAANTYDIVGGKA